MRWRERAVYAKFRAFIMNHVEAARKKQIGLPPKDRWGEAVPDGGTSCNNCIYLKDAEKMICGNKDFVEWNGGSEIPADHPDRYCSIWWKEK